MLPPGNSLIRPFSVSSSAVLLEPSSDDPVVVFFGGEVDPSDKGHEGAGNFSNTILVSIQQKEMISFKNSRAHQCFCGTTCPSMLPLARVFADIKCTQTHTFSTQVLDAASGEVLPCATVGERSPVARGWADACSLGGDKLVVFGGLAGNDDCPERLADTWVCQVKRAS